MVNGFWFSGCCCSGSPCVTHKDEFASYYNLLRYQLADTPGGSTPVALVGWEPYPSPPGRYVELEGEGSFTIDIATPTGELMVGSSIYTLGVGASAGVTIRRADSGDNISLWWLGGTSWELRQGSTVLESISHAGSGEFRLILKTPMSPTTDVEVWLPHAMTGLPELVHTESAVAFVAPSELWHVGLIVDGEAAFDYLESSPCPKIIDCEPPGGCLPTVGAEVPPVVPIVWTMSVPAIANLPGDTDCDLWGDDDFVLVDRWAAVGFDYFDSDTWKTPTATISNETPLPGDTEIYPILCTWIAVIPSFDHRVPECSGEVPPAVPAGKLPVKWLSCPFGNSVGNYPTAAGLSGPTWLLTLQHRNVGTLLAPDMEYRVWLSKHSGIGSTADYIGAWVKYSAADVIGGAFVLSLVQNSGCDDLPATITVTAGGQDEIARRVLECWDTACEPPVTPQPGQCYLINITLADEDGGIWEYQLPLGVQFNESTGGWEWSGGTLSAYPYVHDTCGALPDFTIKIHCVELEEGSTKQWVLDFTTDDGSDRFPMTWLDEEQTQPEFEGATNLMCVGETWDFYAGSFHLATENLEFGSCLWSPCGSSSIGPIILANIEAICSGEVGSEGESGPLVFMASSGLPTNVDPNDVDGTAFYSPLPSGLRDGVMSGVYLYVENGTAKVQITDSGGNPVPGMTATISYSCDPSDGKPSPGDTPQVNYDWGLSPYTTNQFGLCDGESSGFGWWQVTFV